MVTSACKGASVLLGRHPAALAGRDIAEILPALLPLARSAAAAVPRPASGGGKEKDAGKKKKTKSGDAAAAPGVLSRSEIDARRGDGTTVRLLVEARSRCSIRGNDMIEPSTRGSLLPLSLCVLRGGG